MATQKKEQTPPPGRPGRKAKPESERRKLFCPRIHPNAIAQIKVNCDIYRNSQGAYIETLVRQDTVALVEKGALDKKDKAQIPFLNEE